MPDEFDAATKVMESGLLRVLTNQSTDVDDTRAPPVVAVALPEIPAAAPPEAPPARRSRVLVACGIVAAVVLAFDASLLLLRPQRAPRPAAVAAPPDPMPRYMLVPLNAPAPAAIAPPAVEPLPVVATVLPDARQIRAHRHSRHRHAGH